MQIPPVLRFRPEFQPQDPQPPAEAKPQNPTNTQAPPQQQEPQGGEFVTRRRDQDGRPEMQAPSDRSSGGGTPPAGAQQDQCWNTLLMILPMILIFYFLLIRPQQKRDKELRAMIAAVQKGDRVVMNSGLHGTVAQLDDKTVTIRIDGEGKIRLTFDRAAIGRIVREEKAG